eukprot:scaffold1205_cov249-Pinguiococcus_pyrenoidosus.AAC.7
MVRADTTVCCINVSDRNVHQGVRNTDFEVPFVFEFTQTPGGAMCDGSHGLVPARVGSTRVPWVESTTTHGSNER